MFSSQSFVKNITQCQACGIQHSTVTPRSSIHYLWLWNDDNFVQSEPELCRMLDDNVSRTKLYKLWWIIQVWLAAKQWNSLQVKLMQTHSHAFEVRMKSNNVLSGKLFIEKVSMIALYRSYSLLTSLINIHSLILPFRGAHPAGAGRWWSSSSLRWYYSESEH